MPWVSRLSKVSSRQQDAWSWIVAFLLFLASLGLRIALARWLDPLKFLTFYPAIALSSLICGWPQGLFVLILSAAAALYFFFPPLNSFATPDANTIAALISFLLVGGFLVVLVAMMRDLVQRLEEAKLLQEQLFGELQHRVANNLQVVTALINNARRKMRESPMAAEEALAQAESRIHSMSELHRRLYRAQIATIELKPILQDALTEMFHAYEVDLNLDIRSTDLTVDQITALILLVNEAATNSIKHAFSPRLGRHFSVSLSKIRNGPHHLVITDDGTGIQDAKGAGPYHSLGMGIMEALARQLGGSLEILSSDQGTRLIVEFWSRTSRENA
ncbi:MAG: sensor histidine kinase [Methylocystis sp.]|uniref:sensor histidine kinase n=1 Tax=Methylocystis sp. TaxID=1911079 RepID=UPI003DA3592B